MWLRTFKNCAITKEKCLSISIMAMKKQRPPIERVPFQQEDRIYKPTILEGWRARMPSSLSQRGYVASSIAKTVARTKISNN